MKKILKMILCLCLCLACAVPSRNVAAAEDAIEATVWEDFSRSEAGEMIPNSQFGCTEAEGTVTAVNTLGAIGGVNAARLSYSSLRGYHNIAGDQGFQLKLLNKISLENITDLMFYVKMPLSRDDGTGNNWCKSGMAIMMYLGGENWVKMRNQSKVSILPVNGSSWQTLETYELYTDLPSGFEGYVKVSLSDFYGEALTDSIHNHSVEYFILQYSNLGAQCGDAYINAVYGITKDSDSIMVKLNGDATARFLTTGATRADIASSQKLLDIAMRAKPLQIFTSYPTGYDLIENSLMDVENKNDVNASLVDNIGGILENPSIELSSGSMGGFHDTNPMYTVYYPGFQYIDDMEAFLFYIKCADPHPLKPDFSAIRFNLRTEKGGENTWTLLGNGSIKAMEKGVGVWKTYTSSGDGQGIVDLPANFEGWILVDIDDMLTSPIGDDLEDRLLISSTFQFQAVGGECGNGYIDEIYMITDMEDKNNRLITLDDCTVYSLSTDSYATENDLLNIGPKIDYVYDSLPDWTVESYPNVRDVTEDSVVITWDGIEETAEYRVDIYSQVTENGRMAYQCVQSILSEATELLVQNLTKGTKYSIAVTAVSDSGVARGVLKRPHFTTKLESAELADSVITTTATFEREAQAEGSLWWLWILVTAVAASAAAVVIVLVIVSHNKKKRSRGEAE